MKYYTKTANENAITPCLPPCSNKNCNMQMIGQFLCFPHSFPCFMFTQRYHVNFITDKMNSLSEFLSSPLLDFVPSENNERPDKLDMLLKALSESDIQLLNSRVRDDKCQQDHNITNDSVANASDILGALEIPMTTPLRRALLLQLPKLI